MDLSYARYQMFWHLCHLVNSVFELSDSYKRWGCLACKSSLPTSPPLSLLWLGELNSQGLYVAYEPWLWVGQPERMLPLPFRSWCPYMMFQWLLEFIIQKFQWLGHLLLVFCLEVTAQFKWLQNTLCTAVKVGLPCLSKETPMLNI